jgi:hypothetical protein
VAALTHRHTQPLLHTHWQAHALFTTASQPLPCSDIHTLYHSFCHAHKHSHTQPYRHCRTHNQSHCITLMFPLAPSSTQPCTYSLPHTRYAHCRANAGAYTLLHTLSATRTQKAIAAGTQPHTLTLPQPVQYILYHSHHRVHAATQTHRSCNTRSLPQPLLHTQSATATHIQPRVQIDPLPHTPCSTATQYLQTQINCHTQSITAIAASTHGHPQTTAYIVAHTSLPQPLLHRHTQPLLHKHWRTHALVITASQPLPRTDIHTLYHSYCHAHKHSHTTPHTHCRTQSESCNHAHMSNRYSAARSYAHVHSRLLTSAAHTEPQQPSLIQLSTHKQPFPHTHWRTQNIHSHSHSHSHTASAARIHTTTAITAHTPQPQPLPLPYTYPLLQTRCRTHAYM